MAQIAMTVNGECCPASRSSFSNLPVTQRVFEIEGGNAAGVPNVEQLPTIAAIFTRAREWLDELEFELAADPDAPPEHD